MTDPEESADMELELVMPFVACRSQGGPYDDESFVAGWELGALDVLLRAVDGYDTTVVRHVKPAMVPQVDLIAMKHGLGVKAEPWDEHPDEWVKVMIGPAS